jgi:cytochrome c oxidase subunit 2
MNSTVPVFDPASPQALAIHSVFVQVLIISAVIFTVVATLITIAVVKGRRREALPEQNFGNEKAEIAWTIAPILIVFWLAAISARLVISINSAPDVDGDPPPTDITVIGHQWWWQIRYEQSGVIAANEIHIPAGRRMRVRLQSADVIHSFWVPQLGRKMDVIPGRDNFIWFEASEPGVYQGRCAEFCGAQHAWMEFKVYAHTEADFQRWVAGHQVTPPKPKPLSPAAAGEVLFTTLTCQKCHKIAGTSAESSIAPDLSHFASRQEIGGGVIKNTPENLRRWLHDPAAIKPGSKMPNFKLSDEHLDQLVAYLESLE